MEKWGTLSWNHWHWPIDKVTSTSRPHWRVCDGAFKLKLELEVFNRVVDLRTKIVWIWFCGSWLTVTIVYLVESLPHGSSCDGGSLRRGFAKINVNTPGLKLWALNAPKFIVELNFRTFKLDLESPRPVSTMYPRFFRGTGRTEEEEERRSEIYSTASTWWSFRVRVAVSFRIRGWLYPGPSRLEVLWDEFEYFCAAPIQKQPINYPYPFTKINWPKLKI